MTKNVSDDDLNKVSGGIDLSRTDNPDQMPSEDTKEDGSSGGSGGGGGSTTGTDFNQNPPAGLGD